VRNLSALIRAGEVKNDKASLWNATQLLCSLWNHTFGDAGTFRASEAQRARGHAIDRSFGPLRDHLWLEAQALLARMFRQIIALSRPSKGDEVRVH
jgi:hypothetical protein